MDEDARWKMLFAHAVSRKGLTHERDAEEMIKDIQKLDDSDVWRRVGFEEHPGGGDEETDRPSFLENSLAGDIRADGVAERAAHAIGEQDRVFRRGFEPRLALKVSTKHPLMAWLVEHAADFLSTYHFGDEERKAPRATEGKEVATRDGRVW